MCVGVFVPELDHLVRIAERNDFSKRPRITAHWRPEVGTWGGGSPGAHLQSVPRSAWVKTDAASRRVSTDVAFAVLVIAASVSTHALRGTFCTPCTPPPRCPPLTRI